MRTRIGNFDPSDQTVPVTFSYAGINHRRSVRACLDAAGSYDQDATAARVAEVALGVAAKIDSGLLS